MVDNNSRIRALEADNERLRRRMEQRPIHTVPRANSYVLAIDQGNTLVGTSQLGIRYSDTEVTGIPTYDPSSATSFVNGIGRATLYINGVAETGYVLVVNDRRGSFGNALLQGDRIWSGGPVDIPQSAGGSALAYVAG